MRVVWVLLAMAGFVLLCGLIGGIVGGVRRLLSMLEGWDL